MRWPVPGYEKESRRQESILGPSHTSYVPSHITLTGLFKQYMFIVLQLFVEQ